VKAAFIRELGGLERIEFGELPDPVPAGRGAREGPAAALNRLDVFVRNGIRGSRWPFRTSWERTAPA